MSEKTWDLKIWDCYYSVYRGPDQEERISSFKAIMDKYKDLRFRCLQVGVPHVCSKKFGENFVSIDLYDDRPCIDVRASLAETPFNDNEFDFVLCNAVLEHVRDPFECSREMYRIAKEGAEVWIEVPFVQPYHPTKTYELTDGYIFEKHGLGGDNDHGGDYWRFTPQGIVELMRPFKVVKLYLIDQGGVCFWGKK